VRPVRGQKGAKIKTTVSPTHILREFVVPEGRVKLSLRPHPRMLDQTVFLAVRYCVGGSGGSADS